MYIKNKRGQSTVEYVLLVTAVLAVIIAFVTSKNGAFQGQLNSTLGTTANDMNTISGTLSASHQAQPASNSVTDTPPYTINAAP